MTPGRSFIDRFSLLLPLRRSLFVRQRDPLPPERRPPEIPTNDTVREQEHRCAIAQVSVSTHNSNVSVSRKFEHALSDDAKAVTHMLILPYLKYPAPLLKPVSSPRMNIYPFSAPHNKQNRTSSVCNIGLLSRVACMSALSSSRDHAGKSRELKTCAIAHAKDWNQAELDGRPCAFL